MNQFIHWCIHSEISIEYLLFAKDSRHWGYSNEKKIKEKKIPFSFRTYILLWEPKTKHAKKSTLQKKIEDEIY